ncbi:MAG: DUF2262 domain-containing protein [Ruminococcus sp.]|nr:DUF2262 domain-containing protein [Ruminococcus sp.]
MIRKRIGMENVPESIDVLFHSEEKEFLVICVSEDYGYERGDYWEKNVDILGYVETETGSKSNIKGCLIYADRDFEDCFFDNEKIYRIKGRLSKSSDNDIYVTEIISENEKNDFLTDLLTEYRKEVFVISAVLGKLILNKELNWFETTVDWCGKNAGFSVNNNIDENITDAEEFYRNRHEWDKKAREYASESLIELANDWKYSEVENDDDFVEITEKEFAERLEINDIAFYADGNFNIYYADDDMFWGHTVIVSGNIRTGFNEAYF